MALGFYFRTAISLRWPRYAIPNLAEDTRRRYLEVWGTHLLDRVGPYELRALGRC
jgi:hypothetical protein